MFDFIFKFKTVVVVRVVCFAILSSLASAQTLTLDNDSQTYTTLTSTTVTLTGRSDLRITGTTNPITGSIIHLNSSDSWFFMTNIRPSVVSSSYLSQIRVNGANAVINTNCRVVQYADGTVVIPQGTPFAPMQVFTGNHFTGSSTSLSNYTAYNDSNLGIYANNISSFKLKRGYTATIAQNANGTGVSQNYVAQDGDIEVSVLPDELNDSVSFVRIFPWRWTGKKGIAGDIASGLNVRWDYNWNLNRNSTLDTEYVPIRQLRYWPGLGENWQTRGSNHLLGYNEPDQSAQANLAVGDAIYSWPDLLGTGLRVGSPAPSDGGLNWLYSFTDQADAASLRVDFVAVHYYRSYSNAADPDGATTQFYNFLKGVYDRVKRPLWVTEWNNGANWTTGPDPTLAQNAATIQKMIEMLDNTPFVERYAPYNWVEDVRRLKWDDGSLTAAGVNYRDKVSPLAYSQVIPEAPTSPGALYQFENNARDTSAYGHSAVLKGGAKYTTGKTNRGLLLSGNADHVQLSSRIGDSTDFTFGAWIWWDGSSQWQRVFDLGNGTDKYMFLTPNSGGNTLRFAIKNGGAEQLLNHSVALPTATWTHVAVTISGNTGKLFVNGALVATNAAMTINPVDLGTNSNFLGKSQFAADPYFAGKLDDVQFLPYALADANVATMPGNLPPQFTSATIVGNAGTQGVAYSGTLAGTATDPNAGDTINFSKAEGPDWLSVSTNGTLSGTPTFAEEGSQQTIVVATDSSGATALALLTIQLPPVSGNGTWSTDASGNWSEATKWSGNFPANGAGNSANFSTLNITTDRTVILDATRSVGSLVFGDTSGAQNWTLSATNGRTLTLAVNSGTPSIAVNQNTATVVASLAGTAGLNKTGTGTLVLKGDNTLSGTLNIDTSSTTVNEGITRLAHPNAAAAFATLQIRNNNNGASTLELDGSQGPVVVPAAVTLSGRAGTVPAIRNIAGTNNLTGTLSVQSGGANYRIESNAGQLAFTGSAVGAGGVSLRSAVTGTRTLTLQGTGAGLVSGRIENGSADTLNLVKSGTGVWSLDATNTYNGTTTISQGELKVNGTTGAGATTVSSGGTLGGRGTVKSNLTAQSGSKVRIGEQGFPIAPDASFSLVDNFQTYPAGNVGAIPNITGNVWLGVQNGTANANILANDGDNTLAVNGINSGNNPWRGAITDLKNGRASDFSLPHGQTGTYFLRVRRTGTATTDVIFGLSDQAATTTTGPGADTASPWDEYAIMLSIFGDSANSMLRGYDEGFGDVNVSPVSTIQWLNVWIVADNATKTYRLATSTGNDPGTDSGRTYHFGRRTGATVGANPLITFGIHEARNVAAQLDDIHFTRGSNLANPLDPQLLPMAGTLTVQNDFMLSGGSTLEFDVSNSSLFDRLLVGGQFNASGILRVTLDPTTPAPSTGDSFDLFDAGTSVINFSSLDLPLLVTGLSWNTSAIASGVISVTGTPAGYPAWAGTIAFPPGTGGPTVDADGDGIANVFEWLFGSNPLVSDPGFLPRPTARTVTPAEYPGADPAKHYLTMTATVRKSHTGMTLIPQANSDLGSIDSPASAGLVTSALVTDLGDFEERIWIFTQAIEDSPGDRGFMRLKLVGE